MKKEPRAEKVRFNYKNNTVEIRINGKKCRVNKFEAEALKKKLKDSPKWDSKGNRVQPKKEE